MSPPPPPLSPPPIPPSSSTSTADQVATCALRHYQLDLPARRGKPQQPHEWTVYAAFIARHKIKRTCRCVSSATGTKCTAIRLHSPQAQGIAAPPPSAKTAVGSGGGGCIVHDSHAEVLARRGLLRVLWSEIVSYFYDQQQNQNQKKTTVIEKSKEDTQGSCSSQEEEEEGHNSNTNQDQKRDGPADTKDDNSSSSSSRMFLGNLLVPVVPSPTSVDDVDKYITSTDTAIATRSNTNIKSSSNASTVKFRLDPNVQLHLYISDSPCGDASIYEIPQTTTNRQSHDPNNAARKMDGEDGGALSEPLHSPKQQQQKGELLFTGAKVIVSKTTGVDVIKDCGGDHQLLSLGMNQNRNLTQHLHQSQNGNYCYCGDGSSNKGGYEGANGNDAKYGDDGNDKSDECRRTTNNHNTGVFIAREQHQVLGKLRTKAGRSNLPDHLRSYSMSCSDKLALWSIVGVQGAFLTGFLSSDHDDDSRPPIIPITSIVVGRDARLANPTPYNKNEHLGTASTGRSARYNNNNDDDGNSDLTFSNAQYLALERAIPNRVHSVLKALREGPDSPHPFCCHVKQPPTVHVSNHTFASGKSAMAVKEQILTTATAGDDSGKNDKGIKRKRDDSDARSGNSKTKIVPCGTAINWNEADDRKINSKKSSCPSSIEILVGARGIQQGKKPKTQKDYVDLASRLSRSRMVKDFVLKASALINEENKDGTHKLPSDTTYQSLKKQMSCSKWWDTKSRILNHPESPLAGWIRSSQEDNYAV